MCLTLSSSSIANVGRQTVQLVDDEHQRMTALTGHFFGKLGELALELVLRSSLF